MEDIKEIEKKVERKIKQEFGGVTKVILLPKSWWVDDQPTWDIYFGDKDVTEYFAFIQSNKIHICRRSATIDIYIDSIAL